MNGSNIQVYKLKSIKSNTTASTYYDENLWVEVFDGGGGAGQETILSRRRHNHCVHFGHLFVDFHAHGAQSCQVRCTFISGHETEGEKSGGADEVKGLQSIRMVSNFFSSLQKSHATFLSVAT